MKIGLMTFHTAVNYGAVLQAYALQQTLQKHCPGSVEIINYDCAHFKSMYRPVPLMIFRHPKSFLRKLERAKTRKSIRRKFRFFIQQNMLLSGEPVNRRQLTQAAADYDCLITGSDQVWNLQCTGGDPAYFLDFIGGKKKYSYAASFGSAELPQKKRVEIIKYLQDFDRISVREESGRDIVKELISEDVPVVPDPTLLLDAEKWRSMEKPYPIEGDYILLISIEEITQFMRALPKIMDQHMKVVYLNTLDTKIPGVINVRDASPEEYLYLVDHAKYIVSNSFHGCVFSTLFHKQFWCLRLTGAKTNTRMENLMTKLGICENILEPGMDAAVISPIDYDRVDAAVDSMRKEGLAYIEDIFGEQL